MAIHIEWYDRDNGVIYVRFEAQWSWQEYYDAITYLQAQGAQVPGGLICIFDCRQLLSLPKDSLNHFRQSIRQLPYASGPRIIVGANSFLRYVAGLLARLFPERARDHHFVDTMEEAEQVIRRLRSEV